jgi:hypothetical protein
MSGRVALRLPYPWAVAGSARMHIFQHNHELSSGRTSSISQHNIYYDIQGNVLNNNRSNSVSIQSSKNGSSINLIDSEKVNSVIATKSNLLKCLTEREMADRAR